MNTPLNITFFVADSFFDMADSFTFLADLFLLMNPPLGINESGLKKYESGTNNMTSAHILCRIHILGLRIH